MTIAAMKAPAFEVIDQLIGVYSARRVRLADCTKGGFVVTWLTGDGRERAATCEIVFGESHLARVSISAAGEVEFLATVLRAQARLAMAWAIERTFALDFGLVEPAAPEWMAQRYGSEQWSIAAKVSL